MALNRKATLLIGTLVAGHISFYVLKPLLIPTTTSDPVPEKPIFWEQPTNTGQASSSS